MNGIIRSINAAARRSERQAARVSRELEARRKHLEKMREQERTIYEVQVYENFIDRLTTLHKDCGPVYDWHSMAGEQAPIAPIRKGQREANARHRLINFQPGFWDRLLGKETAKRKLLEDQVTQAMNADDQEYQRLLKFFHEAESAHRHRVEFAEHILRGDLKYFAVAVDESTSFAEITDFGSDIQYYFTSSTQVRVTIQVQGRNVIPRQQKSLLKSGKLSTKELPQAKFNELYQDYVCSAVLRIGREIFALLPVEEVVVTAYAELLNQSTGRMTNQPVLSALLVRPTMQEINFDMIDASECLSNFKHNMGFKKSLGMSAVDELT